MTISSHFPSEESAKSWEKVTEKRLTLILFSHTVARTVMD
jgi:hypothetical protein